MENEKSAWCKKVHEYVHHAQKGDWKREDEQNVNASHNICQGDRKSVV